MWGNVTQDDVNKVSKRQGGNKRQAWRQGKTVWVDISGQGLGSKWLHAEWKGEKRKEKTMVMTL